MFFPNCGNLPQPTAVDSCGRFTSREDREDGFLREVISYTLPDSVIARPGPERHRS